MQLVEPVILFFLLGALAGFVRSDLRLPAVLYGSLNNILLLALGLGTGVLLGLSVGGVTLLATLYASASYITGASAAATIAR